MGDCIHFRSVCSDPYTKVIQVQDTNTQTYYVLNQIQVLVCDDRSEGRVFLYKYPTRIQEISQVCF